jgi:hypothetical protein
MSEVVKREPDVRRGDSKAEFSLRRTAQARSCSMKAFLKSLPVLLAGAALAGCGGGGGPGNDSAFNPQGINVTVAPTSLSVGVASFTDITVTVTQANGQPVPDGTRVSVQVVPATIGGVAVAGVTSGGGNEGPGATPQPSVSTGTVASRAVFRFTSAGAAGSGSLAISVQDPYTQGRQINRTVPVTVSGPSTDTRLTLQATRTTLPANSLNVPIFLGSPYIAEVTVTWRRANGELVDGRNVSVSVNPVGQTGGFSTLDDPSTADVNEFFLRLGQGPVKVVAGRATIFFHAVNFATQSTMTVTAVDPDTNETLSRTLTFTINNTAPDLPARVQINAANQPVYVQGAGGTTTLELQVQVSDGSGQAVPDPVSGSTAFNNVRLEIVGEGASFGERLSGINAAGQNVQGSVIAVRTINGIAGAVFHSGTRLGTTSVRATVDRADNNVDNGLQDPLTADRAITVSDGRLFALTITSPAERAIFPGTIENPVGSPSPNPGDPAELPYDGTYRLTVSAVATDRGGNPPLPGTSVGFGLIDEPQRNLVYPGDGSFAIAGTDGDPLEAGFIFRAPTGSFQTAGGGAGPGDILVLFGKAVVGNTDHESARTVQAVDSQTQLRVTQRFNPNDTTGTNVDYGAVLPYAVGRARDGNIQAVAATDARGVATTFMNYPVEYLGKRVIIWVQGTGVPPAGGGLRTVADVTGSAFFAMAPLRLIATPEKIPGNTNTSVLLCVVDGTGNPVRGISIGFSFVGLQTGTGSVDGQALAGVVATPTGVDGCTVASVTTSGILASTTGGQGPRIVFSAGGATDDVEIVVGDLVLQAFPGGFFAGCGSRQIRLRLTNSSGAPVSGVQLVGTCEATGGTLYILIPPGVTDANGETTTSVYMCLDGIGTAGSGTCTFSTATGAPSTVVTFQGVDICTLGFSPPPSGCP